jgi:hypothetical protein
VVWLGWWRGGRRRKVETMVVFILYVLLILQYPKYCGFYRFHKEYLQMLKDAGVIVF